MNKNNNSLALLPNGFADLLPPFAEDEARSIQILMDKFISFGYHRIKPPLLEFEDSLLARGVGAQLSADTFRVMDPVSHKMLGLRSDVTAQVSRIVSSRLGGAARPLRLAYASDVLRIRGSQMRTERQFTQVGCELVGSSKCADSDIEICVLSVLGLKALGICDITLDLTLPRFVSSLLKDVADDEATIIKKAVAQRDIDALSQIKSMPAKLMAQAMGVSGAADTALAGLGNIEFDDNISGEIKHLRSVCDGIKKALADLDINDVNLSVDVLEQDGFEYHEALGFTLFADGLSAELGRGGRYDVRFGGDESGEVARGFTIFMDAVAKLSTAHDEGDKIFVSSNENWNIIADLQEQGWVVIRGFDDNVMAECTHIYKNGKINKI